MTAKGYVALGFAQSGWLDRTKYRFSDRKWHRWEQIFGVPLNRQCRDDIEAQIRELVADKGERGKMISVRDYERRLAKLVTALRYRAAGKKQEISDQEILESIRAHTPDAENLSDLDRAICVQEILRKRSEEITCSLYKAERKTAQKIRSIFESVGANTALTSREFNQGQNSNVHWKGTPFERFLLSNVYDLKRLRKSLDVLRKDLTHKDPGEVEHLTWGDRLTPDFGK